MPMFCRQYFYTEWIYGDGEVILFYVLPCMVQLHMMIFELHVVAVNSDLGIFMKLAVSYITWWVIRLYVDTETSRMTENTIK